MKKQWLVLCLILLSVAVSGCSRAEADSTAPENTAMPQETSAAEELPVEDTATQTGTQNIPEDPAAEDSVQQEAEADAGYEVDWEDIDVSKVDISLPDEFFLHYMDDIYKNLPDYLNKVVSGEGYIYYMDEAGTEFAFVRDFICCGPDAYPVGIICRYDGDTPADDTWVTITGVVGKEKGQFTDTPVLHVTSLKKTKEKKGQRLVDY